MELLEPGMGWFFYPDAVDSDEELRSDGATRLTLIGQALTP